MSTGTLVAAAGFILSGWTAGFFGLALCLALSGAGASVQHPLGSALTSRAFEGERQLQFHAGARHASTEHIMSTPFPLFEEILHAWR